MAPYEKALDLIEKARFFGYTELVLGGTGLRMLPPEIGQLINLTKLYISPEYFTFDASPKLTALPPEIGQLANLIELRLQNNNLRTLPPEIGQLANLTELRLQNNNLRTLPPEIGQLTNLTMLSPSKNQLTTLPPEIGQLTNLTVLHLEGGREDVANSRKSRKSIMKCSSWLTCGF